MKGKGDWEIIISIVLVSGANVQKTRENEINQHEQGQREKEEILRSKQQGRKGELEGTGGEDEECSNKGNSRKKSSWGTGINCEYRKLKKITKMFSSADRLGIP